MPLINLAIASLPETDRAELSRSLTEAVIRAWNLVPERRQEARVRLLAREDTDPDAPVATVTVQDASLPDEPVRQALIQEFESAFRRTLRLGPGQRARVRVRFEASAPGLLRLRRLEEMEVRALDGEVGQLSQALFDQDQWTIRYFAVASHRWLRRREVLLSPMAVSRVDLESRRIEVSLTRDQIARSPDLDSAQPISRVMEKRYADYFRWPYYWTGAGVWGVAPDPGTLRELAPPSTRELAEREEAKLRSQYRLQATDEVRGYRIHSSDHQDFGRVEDFQFDPVSFHIPFLVLSMAYLSPLHLTLVPTRLVQSISWTKREVMFGMTRKEIEQSPSFRSEEEIEVDEGVVWGWVPPGSMTHRRAG